MTSEKQKKITLISPVSQRYVIVVEPKRTMKSDGQMNDGLKIHFKNGIAEVTEELFEDIKVLPQFGVDFMVKQDSQGHMSAPPRPTPATLAGSIPSGDINEEIKELKNQVQSLVAGFGALASAINNK